MTGRCSLRVYTKLRPGARQRKARGDGLSEPRHVRNQCPYSGFSAEEEDCVAIAVQPRRRDITQGILTQDLLLVYRAVYLPQAGPGVTAARGTSSPAPRSPLLWRAGPRLGGCEGAPGKPRDLPMPLRLGRMWCLRTGVCGRGEPVTAPSFPRETLCTHGVSDFWLERAGRPAPSDLHKLMHVLLGRWVECTGERGGQETNHLIILTMISNSR